VFTGDVELFSRDEVKGE